MIDRTGSPAEADVCKLALIEKIAPVIENESDGSDVKCMRTLQQDLMRNHLIEFEGRCKKSVGSDYRR